MCKLRRALVKVRTCSTFPPGRPVFRDLQESFQVSKSELFLVVVAWQIQHGKAKTERWSRDLLCSSKGVLGLISFSLSLLLAAGFQQFGKAVLGLDLATQCHV